MIEVLSATSRNELRAQFDDKRLLQSELRDTHEKSGAFGLGYLALWAILETFAKQLCAARERERLQADLQKWVEFMNGVHAVRPAELTTAKYKPGTFLNASIPPQKQLTPLIAADQAPAFYLVLDPEQKYRKRRNKIAHSGDVISEYVYDDFKEQATEAIKEIDRWLSHPPKKAKS